MRVGLIGQVRRVWAPRGTKVQQGVEYKREWVYLNLAVNGLTGELRWDWTTNMKGESIAPVVTQWADEGVDTIVWDRAPGHRGAAYQDVAVNLVEQPPYSPELNPAERVFEYLRSRIEGRVYGAIATKKQAVETELENLSAAPEKVISLAGWDWIRHSVSGLWDIDTAFE
jgi:transposase